MEAGFPQLSLGKGCLEEAVIVLEIQTVAVRSLFPFLPVGLAQGSNVNPYITAQSSSPLSLSLFPLSALIPKKSSSSGEVRRVSNFRPQWPTTWKERRVDLRLGTWASLEERHKCSGLRKVL